MNTILYIFCVTACAFQQQMGTFDTFKLASSIYDIECINSDRALNDCIQKLNNIDKNKLNKDNSNLLDYFLKDLNNFKKMDDKSRDLRYKELIEQNYRFSTVNTVMGNGLFLELNMIELDKELKKLISLFGPESYWVFNFRINFIISKLIRKNNYKIIEDIKICEGILENNKIRNSILGGLSSALYCLHYENKGDWASCEKYARESIGKYPVGFNQNYLATPVSFLIKSSFFLKKNDQIEGHIKILGYKYIVDLDNDRNPALFRINETLAKYYLQNGKTTNAISHQEIALVHISKMAPKDSEEVKAVATDLRNMLKQNNEIQAMRNLEERYNLKPLP